MRKAMARANRCFCRREDALTNVAREKMSEIENGFFDRREFIKKLENIDIILPKSQSDKD